VFIFEASATSHLPRPHCVRRGPTSPKKGTTAPNFRPMSIVAKRSSISATAELLFEKNYH